MGPNMPSDSMIGSILSTMSWEHPAPTVTSSISDEHGPTTGMATVASGDLMDTPSTPFSASTEITTSPVSLDQMTAEQSMAQTPTDDFNDSHATMISPLDDLTASQDPVTSLPSNKLGGAPLASATPEVVFPSETMATVELGRPGVTVEIYPFDGYTTTISDDSSSPTDMAPLAAGSAISTLSTTVYLGASATEMSATSEGSLSLQSAVSMPSEPVHANATLTAVLSDQATSIQPTSSSAVEEPSYPIDDTMLSPSGEPEDTHNDNWDDDDQGNNDDQGGSGDQYDNDQDDEDTGAEELDSDIDFMAGAALAGSMANDDTITAAHVVCLLTFVATGCRLTTMCRSHGGWLMANWLRYPDPRMRTSARTPFQCYPLSDCHSSVVTAKLMASCS